MASLGIAVDCMHCQSKALNCTVCCTLCMWVLTGSHSCCYPLPMLCRCRFTWETGRHVTVSSTGHPREANLGGFHCNAFHLLIEPRKFATECSVHASHRWCEVNLKSLSRPSLHAQDVERLKRRTVPRDRIGDTAKFPLLLIKRYEVDAHPQPDASRLLFSISSWEARSAVASGPSGLYMRRESTVVLCAYYHIEDSPSSVAPSPIIRVEALDGLLLLGFTD